MSQYVSEAKLNEDMSKKLIVACSNANRAEVEKILENDPNPEKTVNEKNNMGETALHVAATGGDHYIIQRLLQHNPDLRASDKHGNTPLMRAAILGNDQAVQVFIDHDETNIFDRGSNGQTPLHCAALIGNIELVNHFLELDPEHKNVKVRDNEGNTPFHAAAQPPCIVEVMDALLENGADLNEANNAGETALLIAARAEAMKGIKFLLEREAEFKPAKNGRNPLHEVAFRRNVEAVKLFLNLPKVDLEVETAEGETALALAAAGGSIEILKILIDKKAAIGKSVLHQAVKYEREEVVQFLIERVDVNSLDKSGKTALILAVENDKPEMVKVLLQNRANIMIKFNDTETGKQIDALTLAKNKGYKECEAMLKKAKKDGCIVC